MRLTSVTLENFRCFEKETVHLHPQLNVFVGLNASGKTALLEGIGLGIASFTQSMSIHRSMSGLILPSDVRQVPTLTSTSLPVRIRCTGKLHGLDDEHVWLNKYGESFTEQETSAQNILFSGRYYEIAKGNDVTLPVLYYFSTQRLWGGDDSEENKVQELSGNIKRLGAYVDALSRKSNTLHFEKELEQMQLVVSQGKEFGFSYDSSRLDLIRRIAAKVIEDCRIFYYDYEKQSLAVIFNDGRRLTISELSDGQKSLLLISTGIAFQCATLNPHLGLDAYKSEGVVLIDEVELHLHPDWQRQILPILTREFPNIQFICTTHSPQVISALRPENVQIIKDFKVTQVSSHITGRDSNSILREVFKVHERPSEFSTKLSKFYHALDTEDLTTALATFEELEQNWGSLDTEVVQAGWRLQDLQAELASK